MVLRAVFTLIENGEVYAPMHLGRRSVLIANERIVKLGAVDRAAVEALGVECRVIDAEGCVVAPGLIDPHIHLLGGSGEGGFNRQSPEFFIGEIVRFGITTVVGVLGVDTTMKTMAGLLAKAKALKEDGVNALVWSGGYSVPPTGVMHTVRDDIMFIEEVIGAGEIAISDPRGMDPSPRDLARLAHDCHVGGLLAKKAGLLHLHVGEADTRLEPLRQLLDEYNVEPGWLYPTHVARNTRLFDEAIALARKGMPVDVDVVEEDAAHWVKRWRDADAPPELLTLSSDASITSPRTLYEQVRACIHTGAMDAARVLALVTRNTAAILRLGEKGTLAPGKIADVVVFEGGSWEVLHVLAEGRVMVEDGRLDHAESFLSDSDRVIELTGAKAYA